MSFGFSVGDFIAVFKLIADIRSVLNDAKSEYRELFQELELLHNALGHLDRLHCDEHASSKTLDSIKYTALSCRRPLEDFLAKIKQYDGSLGVEAKPSLFRNTADKLRFAFGHKNEAQRLQNYLSIHIGTLNILLAEHGLEKMDVAIGNAEADRLHIRKRLENTHSIIERIGNSMAAQALLVQTVNSKITQLLNMIAGDLKSSWTSLCNTVAKVCVSTQQIYTIVVEIKSSLSTVDTRWTYFQAPCVVEDALGFKYPVPSEFDYDLLNTIIKHRFREGPGSIDVKLGNYELFELNDRSRILPAAKQLQPGMAITMAVFIGVQELTDERCPVWRCGSQLTTPAHGGGRICCECNVWIGRSHKPRDLLDVFSNTYGLQMPLQQRHSFRTNLRGYLLKLQEFVEFEMKHTGAFRNVTLERLAPGEYQRKLSQFDKSGSITVGGAMFWDLAAGDPNILARFPDPAFRQYGSDSPFYFEGLQFIASKHVPHFVASVNASKKVDTFL
ncbi:MAG: hypothetical protein M1821_000848 [Bathelium mastoideum]|nr:MAG: hypothetical protein M1821_000848 [Bathelium mastoideum]